MALALTVYRGAWTEARATKAGVRRVEMSSAMRMGHPAKDTSLPKGQVVAIWPGMVVGAICPPVMP